MRYLCLHGFTGGPDSFAGCRLPQGSVVAVLGGHLGTDVAGDFHAEVERLATLGAGCRGLFGYSHGGRLALAILARYPERFEHALVVSGQAGLRNEDERRARREADARWVSLLRERGLTAFVDAWQALPLWASQAALPDAALAVQRAQRLRHTAEGLSQSLLHHGLGEMPDLRPSLSTSSTRVDLLVGERDRKFVALAEELAQLMPRARLSVAPDAGHNLLLERPTLCDGLLEYGPQP